MFVFCSYKAESRQQTKQTTAYQYATITNKNQSNLPQKMRNRKLIAFIHQAAAQD